MSAHCSRCASCPSCICRESLGVRSLRLDSPLAWKTVALRHGAKIRLQPAEASVPSLLGAEYEPAEGTATAIDRVRENPSVHIESQQPRAPEIARYREVFHPELGLQ